MTAHGHEMCHVFLSHAGQQKKAFVDCLHSILRRIDGSINVFMDEHSMVPGDPRGGWPSIVEAAEKARVAVVLLSAEFVCKKGPMKELEIFLRRRQVQQPGRTDIIVVPVFWNLTYQQCDNLERDVYSAWPANDPSMPLQAPEVQKQWAGLVKQLLEVTAVRSDQARDYQGMLASHVADVVVGHLRALRLLPPEHSEAMQVDWDRVSPDLIPPLHKLVGREREVEEVLEGVRGPARAAVLVGGPGEGKTSIAAVAGLQLWQAGWFPRGIVVVDFAGYDATNLGGVESFMATRIHQQLLALQGEWPRPKDGSWEEVRLWLARASDGPVLLVLENTEDAQQQEDALQQEQQPIQELMGVLRKVQQLSYGGQACVRMIICSRKRLDLGLNGAPHVIVGGLPQDPAKELLIALSGQATLWEDGQADTLAEFCGCNALAVSLIAGFLRSGRCTPKEAIRDHERTGDLAQVAVLANQPGVSTELGNTRVHQHWLQRYLSQVELEAVARASVFSGSFSAQGAEAVGVPPASVPVSRQAAARLSSLRSHGSFKRSTHAAASVTAQPVSHHLLGVTAMLQQLVHMSVVQEVAVPGIAPELDGVRFQMHPLVRVLGIELRKTMTMPGSSDDNGLSVELSFVHWMLCSEQGPGQLMVQHSPNMHPVQASSCASVHEARIALRQHVAIAEDANMREVARMLGSWELLNRQPAQQQLMVIVDAGCDVAGAYHQAGLRSFAELLAVSLLSARCSLKHAATGGDVHTITRPSNVCTMLRESLSGQLQPDDLVKLARQVELLYELMQRRGLVDPAEQMLEDLLEKQRQVLHKDHESTLRTHLLRADVFCARGQLLLAQELEQHVLDQRLNLLGSEHLDTLQAMRNLSNTLVEQGDLRRAQRLQEHVLEQQRRMLGTEHLDTITTMACLAYTYCLKQDLERALQLAKQVLDQRLKVQGSQHPDTITAMEELGTIHRENGDLGRAVQLQEDVLDLRMKVLGAKHPDIFRARANLAAAHYQKGDLGRARQLTEQVFDECSKVFGSKHPHTITAMESLAMTHSQTGGDMGRALQLQEQVLNLRVEVLGNEHPDTITATYHLATIHYQKGDLGRARQLQEQVLDLRRQVLGNEHPDTITATRHLAATRYHNGDLGRALQLQQDVLDQCLKVLGSEHPDTIKAMEDLGVIHIQKGNLGRALQLQQVVLDHRLKVLGSEPPDTVAATVHLAEMQRQMAARTNSKSKSRMLCCCG